MFDGILVVPCILSLCFAIALNSGAQSIKKNQGYSIFTWLALIVSFIILLWALLIIMS